MSRVSLSILIGLALDVSACDDSESEAQCDRSAASPAPTNSVAVPVEPAAHDAGEAEECESEELGPPTGALCPSDSTLTYENFAKPFMEKYCTSCHASTLVGVARQGAPEYHDFDSEQGILVVADHVDQKAGAGPDAVNELMPEGSGPVPTLAEREQLGEWLACALAAM